MLVSRLEARPEIEAALTASFERMLARYRAAQRTRTETNEPVGGVKPPT
jgi:hypothetical protein